MTNALDRLMKAVAKTEVKLDKQDTNAILFEGVDMWNDALDALDCVSPELMELAKSGGNIYSPALETYAKIDSAVKAMLEIKHIRTQAEKDYERYTGVKLSSVLEHNADSTRKVVKAFNISMPLLKELRAKREALTIAHDQATIRYTMAERKVKTLPQAEQDKLAGLLLEAENEVISLLCDLTDVSKEIVDTTEYCKVLEVEHGYTYNDKGTRVYNKTSDFNTEHSEVLKAGRTALTEFKKFEKLSGLNSVIPTAEVTKAARLFNMSHVVDTSSKCGMVK